MNVFSAFYCRFFQVFIKIGSKIVKFRIPNVRNSIDEIPTILENKKLKHPIIVSSKTVSKQEEYKAFLESLKKEGISFETYTSISPDPTFDMVEKLADFYINYNCDSIIAIGGGSVIDASKAMGVLVTNSTRDLSHFKGVLKVHKDLPYFIAVPTTAGTGSEATIASVVTNEKTKDKFSISDGHLVPKLAILDNRLLKSLPKHIIAQTGMDAFSHAIESYVSKSRNKIADEYAIKSLKLIKDNLLDFYENPENDVARSNMLQASFDAGVALTRAYVGYVHSLAHAVGAQYHKAHGYCISILLPYVFEAYGKKVYKRLANLYDILQFGEKQTEEEKALTIIQYMKDLNKAMSLEPTFNGLIKKEDYSSLAKHAAKEANPLYPVPKLLTKNDLIQILKQANNDLE